MMSRPWSRPSPNAGPNRHNGNERDIDHALTVLLGGVVIGSSTGHSIPAPRLLGMDGEAACPALMRILRMLTGGSDALEHGLGYGPK